MHGHGRDDETILRRIHCLRPTAVNRPATYCAGHIVWFIVATERYGRTRWISGYWRLFTLDRSAARCGSGIRSLCSGGGLHGGCHVAEDVAMVELGT